MRTLIALVVLLGVLCVCTPYTAAAKVPPGPIKHFIVLMMENRAFDHMLGWMHEKNPDIIGLNGTQRNPWWLNEAPHPNDAYIYANKLAHDVRFCLFCPFSCRSQSCAFQYSCYNIAEQLLTPVLDF